MKLSGPVLEPKTKATKALIFLHGLGADGNDLIGLAPFFRPAFPDAVFIAPNAPFPCDMAPFGYQWFSLRDWTPESMLKGAKEAAPVLDAFIDDAMQRYFLKESSVAIIGFSQGTMMALYTALRRKKPVAAIVGFSGALIGPELLKNEIISKPPICLVHGTADEIVPFAAMDMAATALSEAGVEIESHARPGLGHSIDEGGVEFAKDFISERIT